MILEYQYEIIKIISKEKIFLTYPNTHLVFSNLQFNLNRLVPLPVSSRRRSEQLWPPYIQRQGGFCESQSRFSLEAACVVVLLRWQSDGGVQRRDHPFFFCSMSPKVSESRDVRRWLDFILFFYFSDRGENGKYPSVT